MSNPVKRRIKPPRISDMQIMWSYETFCYHFVLLGMYSILLPRLKGKDQRKKKDRGKSERGNKQKLHDTELAICGGIHVPETSKFIGPKPE